MSYEIKHQISRSNDKLRSCRKCAIRAMSKDKLLKKYEQERTMTDCWSRVMGYYRPARLVHRNEDGTQHAGSSYNKGKVSEFKERVFFRTLPSCCKCK